MLPMLMLMIFGTMQISLLMYSYNVMVSAARDTAARDGGVHDHRHDRRAIARRSRRGRRGSRIRLAGAAALPVGQATSR